MLGLNNAHAPPKLILYVDIRRLCLERGSIDLMVNHCDHGQLHMFAKSSIVSECEKSPCFFVLGKKIKNHQKSSMFHFSYGEISIDCW
jgi:hypothetical protein